MAAYQLIRDYNAAKELAHNALRPQYGITTLVHVNDTRGHAAVLALFDEFIAEQLVRSKSLALIAGGLRAQPGKAGLLSYPIGFYRHPRASDVTAA
jgi:hypothetical protein